MKDNTEVPEVVRTITNQSANDSARNLVGSTDPYKFCKDTPLVDGGASMPAGKHNSSKGEAY